MRLTVTLYKIAMIATEIITLGRASTIISGIVKRNGNAGIVNENTTDPTTNHVEMLLAAYLIFTNAGIRNAETAENWYLTIINAI